MSYNFDDNETATLESALNVYGNADELRKLAAQIEQKPPTKKADLAALILRHLEGDGLRAAWEKLQQATVAETVHSQSCGSRLIIYDEVHLLPAQVFRATADLQAHRRLGLTATLVREDGREGEVFALIGPKRFDVPWKDLERQSWIATATCVEERVPMSADRRMEYALADKRYQFRIAAENPTKIRRLRELLANHPERRVLIMGEYIA